MKKLAQPNWLKGRVWACSSWRWAGPGYTSGRSGRPDEHPTWGWAFSAADGKKEGKKIQEEEKKGERRKGKKKTRKRRRQGEVVVKEKTKKKRHQQFSLSLSKGLQHALGKVLSYLFSILPLLFIYLLFGSPGVMLILFFCICSFFPLPVNYVANRRKREKRSMNYVL